MDTKELSVADVMSERVFTVARNATLSAAAELMREQRVRHLPVMDEDGDLAGVITQRDLFHSGLVKAMGYGSHGVDKVRGMVRVKEAMRSDPLTVTPDMALPNAAAIMFDRKVGCLPVIDDGRLVGILTEGDFVALAARGAGVA